MTTRRKRPGPREILPGRRNRTERAHPEELTTEEWALLEDMSVGERLAWLEERQANAPRPPRNV